MGRLDKGIKPTRAERKAAKKAAREAAKQVEFDARDLAKEEKRAAKAGRSRWGRRRKDADADENELLLEEEMTEASVGSNYGSDHGRSMAQPIAPDPLPDEPRRKMERRPDDILSQMHAGPDLDLGPVREPRRTLGQRILRKGVTPDFETDKRSEPMDPQGIQTGTQVRPVRGTGPLAGGDRGNTPDGYRPPEGSFADLRHAVSDQKTGIHQPSEAKMNNVLVLDDPLVEPDGSGQPGLPASRKHVEPLRLEPEDRLMPPASGLSENWLGLWLSEEGEAIYVEEDGDGWFAVTVMPDPTSTCYAGPEYPEIQSYRMPASYEREALGEFDGERLSVITVPGLPDSHRSPMMHIYFLTSVPAAEGGGSRFATPDDPTRRVFIVADLELGTVNPWSDRDDIDWIDPSINYYKAPGKLDAYMMRRMARDEPLN